MPSDLTQFTVANKQQKIIIAASIFPPDIGGPATYTQAVVNGLLKQEVKISVITFSSLGKKPDAGYRIERVWRGWPKIIRHSIYFFKLLRLARGAGLIYAQNATSVGLPALVASRFLKSKLAVKIVIDSTIEVARIQNSTLASDLELKKYGGTFGSKFRSFFQKLVARRADLLITPCLYLKNVVTNWGVEPNKIAVVYNGVETRRPTLTKSEAKEKIGIKGNIILSIGRVVAGKGFRMLIKILPRLVEEVNPHIVLVILGDGYDLENLRKMAENLRVKNRVHFVGKKRPEEVWDYFFAADSFVLNSYSEGFPHVVLEAMAAGLPVVTTAVGGTPELIKNGRDGILLKYNDETGLIETIKIIYQNEELRQQLIENAQLTAGNFSVDKMIEMTTELLKKAINV